MATADVSTKSITVVAQPGPLGVFVDEVPGEEYLCVSGLKRNSPLNETMKVGDRLQGMNGVDLKGWSLEKLATYCKDHSKTLKNIDILQATTNFGLTPRKKKVVAHKKSSSPPKTSSRQRKKMVGPTPPPMSVFETLRPPPPAGYERKIVDVPAGRMGIRVKMRNGILAIFEVVEDSPIKHLVQVDDMIEGVDSLYEEKWDMPRFLEHIKETNTRSRSFHMFVKKKPPINNSCRLPIPTPQKSRKTSKHYSPTAAKVLELITSPGGTSVKKQEPQHDVNGLYPKLDGRSGLVWDEEYGVWIPSAV